MRDWSGKPPQDWSVPPIRIRPTVMDMVDNLVLGSMFFGTLLDERRSFELLDRFVDAGGVWIDTANCYAFWIDPSGFGGQNEALLGRWLASRPGVRTASRSAPRWAASRP